MGLQLHARMGCPATADFPMRPTIDGDDKKDAKRYRALRDALCRNEAEAYELMMLAYKFTPPSFDTKIDSLIDRGDAK